MRLQYTTYNPDATVNWHDITLHGGRSALLG